MSLGVSLHIGLKRVAPGHYPGVPKLVGCENDARAMERLAKLAGFKTMVLIDEAATAEAVLGAIHAAAPKIGGSGILMITFSGHGSVMNGNTIPSFPGNHETWCLYDRELVDQE